MFHVKPNSGDEVSVRGETWENVDSPVTGARELESLAERGREREREKERGGGEMERRERKGETREERGRQGVRDRD